MLRCKPSIIQSYCVLGTVPSSHIPSTPFHSFNNWHARTVIANCRVATRDSGTLGAPLKVTPLNMTKTRETKVDSRTLHQVPVAKSVLHSLRAVGQGL